MPALSHGHRRAVPEPPDQPVRRVGQVHAREALDDVRDADAPRFDLLVCGRALVDVADVLEAGATIEADATKLGARLRKALSQGPLVALDGANVIDPRLIAFLVRRDGSCAASRGEGDQRAVALRLVPELADAIPEQAEDLRTVAETLMAAGLIAPFDEKEFPAYMDKLRRSLPYWIHAVTDTVTRQLSLSSTRIKIFPGFKSP